ncbi:MAG: ECF transporter S component [Candidatus Limnocylindria bacterium]
MTTMTVQRPSWELGTRTIVYAAIGAALYAVAGYFSFFAQIPGTEGVYLRPAFGILTFFGFAFGPFVGLFTGLVGNALADTLTGSGPFTFWHWSVANGLVGLIAGYGPAMFRGMMGSSSGRATVAAITAVVATVVGFLFIWIELIIQPELGFNTILTAEYIPTVVSNSIFGVILTPILVLAWEPLSERLGR